MREGGEGVLEWERDLQTKVSRVKHFVSLMKKENLETKVEERRRDVFQPFQSQGGVKEIKDTILLGTL